MNRRQQAAYEEAVKKQEEINKISAKFAEFDGFEFMDDAPTIYPNGYYLLSTEEGNLHMDIEDFDYHTNYSVLMEIIDNIETYYPYNVVIVRTQCQVFRVEDGKPIIEVIGTSKREAIFHALGQLLDILADAELIKIATANTSLNKLDIN